MKYLHKFRAWLHRDGFEAVQPLSFRAAKFFDYFFTANRMTLLGLLLCIPAGVFFFWNDVVAGTIFMIMSLFTDWFDGAIGRYQEKKYHKSQGLKPMTLEEEMQLSFVKRVNLRGVTHLGRSLDPLVDKVRTFVFLLTIGYNIVSLWVIRGIIAVGITLTCVRLLKQKMKLDHVGANRFGKYKIWVEVIGMGTLVFLYQIQDWVYYKTCVNVCFVFAFAFGLASLVGHLATGFLVYRKRERIVRLNAKLTRESTRP